MSGNQDMFSSVRLQLEAEDGKVHPLADTSPLGNVQKLSATSTSSDKKRKWSFRRNVSTVSSPGNLDLYEDDTTNNMPSLSSYLKSLSGIAEVNESKRAAEGGGGHGNGKNKLGTLFGVYLPSIQHILGVQMFLRLLWVVGIAGFVESFTMVFVCCLCTFLTSISISAIATNGVIDSGGAYFMISRNLGPEFGGAIGILYYLANTVATSMYLVGGVEILLVYMAPGLPQFGDPTNHEDESSMFNNFRLYATGFLLIVFVVCAFGVKFVQFFAPISLACVFLSILAVFAGAFTASPDNGPQLCMLGNVLLKSHVLKDANGTVQCNKTEHSPLWHHYCHGYNETHISYCDPYFESNDVHVVPGIPGFGSDAINKNAWPAYMSTGESFTGHPGNREMEITQDITTTFFLLLAIFFPSVTGIMTGANMSGDLTDPQKSIPVGTIAATLTTSVIYLLLVIIYACTIQGALLRDKYGESLENMMVVAKLAWPSHWILLVGSFTSCIGAGLQCLCTAPRLLQSIAKDDLLPFLRPFSQMTKGNEPFRALLLTTLIAECAVLIGGIDYIAPVVDFFFLMSYCFVNLACALQTLLKAPNWRPRFKFYHWTLAVVGALLNLFIMFSTHWYYAIIVLLLCAGIYKYIEFKGAKKEWGDGMRGLALSTAQYSLMRVEDVEVHPKNWRPQLLVLLKLKDTEELNNRKMLQLANQLKASRGLTIVASLLKGDLNVDEDRQAADLAKQKLKLGMKEAKVKGFTEVVLCSNISDNVGTMIQCVGMGGLRPNTVMIGWPHGWKDDAIKHSDNYTNFLDAVHRATSADMCLLVPRGLNVFPEAQDQWTGKIDVWWIIHDGGLLILLPFLLKQHKVWRNCSLRVFAVAQVEDNSLILPAAAQMKNDLEKWVYQLRIEAEVIIVELADNTIAPYTYERTLVMEERAKLAINLHLTNRQFFNEPQLLADRNRNGAPELATPKSRKKSSIAQLASKIFSINDESGSVQKSSKDNKTLKIEIMPPLVEQTNVEKSNVSHDNPIFENDLDTVKKPTDVVNHEVKVTGDLDEFRERVSSAKAIISDHKMKKHEVNERFAGVDRKNLRKMHNAVKLNKAIKEQSLVSRLVVLNLPKPPKSSEGLHQYMEYLEVLTDGLERVLLVRGSGKEVITIYS